MAKLRASEAGFRARDRALQTLGGFGYARKFQIERYWRESRLFRIAPISNEMVLNFITQHVFDLPPLVLTGRDRWDASHFTLVVWYPRRGDYRWDS